LFGLGLASLASSFSVVREYYFVPWFLMPFAIQEQLQGVIKILK
jgi:hypothetical protein